VREPGPDGDQVDLDAVSDPSRHEVQQAYRRAHRHPGLRRGTIAPAGGLALLLVVGVMAYLKLNSNITQLDVSKLLGKRPVTSADRVTNLKPLNILVIGSDTRALGTIEFGTTAAAGGLRHDADCPPVWRPKVSSGCQRAS
jgi:hypothetical protein